VADPLPPIPDIIEFLRSAEPEMLELMGEASVLEAFGRAAAEVPAYGDMLRARGVDPAAVADIDSFRRLVPLTDKEATFGRYPVRELCRGGSVRGIKTIVPSSGHSGSFAFSVDVAEGGELAAKGADLAFHYVLGVLDRPTLVVNCYPMGLQVPTSMAVANAGVNADVALGIIKALAGDFEQLIVVSQPPFVKHLLEQGLEQGVDWRRLRTSVVAGGEGFVESWRTYVSGLVGIADPDRPEGTYVASSMGAGELGLNLFHEIPESIRIIRRAYRDPVFRTELVGSETATTPHFFVYYPMRSFIESIPLDGWPGGELAVSHTALDLPMPLFRYRTGDLVRLIPYRRLEEVLARLAPDLALPGLRLPCAAVFGRRDGLELGRSRVTIEMLKEALFLDGEVASAVTGFFRAGTDGAKTLTMEVQLRAGRAPGDEIEDRLVQALRVTLPRSVDHRIRLYPHEAFPQHTTYERKHHYLVR